MLINTMSVYKILLSVCLLTTLICSNTVALCVMTEQPFSLQSVAAFVASLETQALRLWWWNLILERSSESPLPCHKALGLRVPQACRKISWHNLVAFSTINASDVSRKISALKPVVWSVSQRTPALKPGFVSTNKINRTLVRVSSQIRHNRVFYSIMTAVWINHAFFFTASLAKCFMWAVVSHEAFIFSNSFLQACFMQKRFFCIYA